MKRYRILGVVVIVTLLVLGLWQGLPEAQKASQQVQIDPKVIKFYQQRELQASPTIKGQLQTLRKEISAKNYTFQVGYTEAMDYTIEQITGLVEPPDLQKQIREQNVLAEKAMDKKLLSDIAGLCSASASSFDWRKVKGCVGVRNQKACGSGWAFVTHGAFEGSYRIINGCCRDTSEQDTLDCNPWGYSCAGGWWAHQYLINKGSAKESVYPYTAVKGTCKSVARPYKAVTWGYVGSSSGVPSVASLKNALCKYGPLAVAVKVNAAFQAYSGGVFNACVSGKVNHGVTLMGWDDSKGAWLIKNSWGTSWGSTGGYGSEKGYMWIKYNCSKIGYAASWVQAKKITEKCCP